MVNIEPAVENQLGVLDMDEHRQMRSIRDAAEAIINDRREYTDGGWSLDYRSDDKPYIQDDEKGRMSITIDKNSTGGFEPNDVALQMQKVLIEQAMAMDPKLKAEYRSARQKEADYPPEKRRRPLVETGDPNDISYATDEMWEMHDRLQKLVPLVPMDEAKQRFVPFQTSTAEPPEFPTAYEGAFFEPLEEKIKVGKNPFNPLNFGTYVTDPPQHWLISAPRDVVESFRAAKDRETRPR